MVCPRKGQPIEKGLVACDGDCQLTGGFMRKTITYMAQRSVLACALLILIPGGALAATWTVTKTADTNDGVCDADCSFVEGDF